MIIIVAMTETASREGALRLTDWGVIRASGEDARSFLHAQLTQDVSHLLPGEARLAGYCSPKGRLLASFVLWSRGPAEVLLACSADLLPATLKRLSMFVLRAKCKLVDASAELGVWGVAFDPAEGPDHWPSRDWAWQRDGDAACIRLPDAPADGGVVHRMLWVGPATSAGPSQRPALAADAWAWLEARSGVARIVAATVDQFVPQMVNMELVGGVNFQKGCYPGQEVVARSQYRGTLKRRSYVVHGDSPLVPGDEVYHGDDAEQAAGMVVLAGRRGSQWAALVELKIAATLAGELRAKSAAGPRLVLDPLPYAFPAEAA
jgi:folate-binding protein YgfZ